MPDITINDVIVNFPFNPYSVQVEYMSKIIECLQNSTNGVLESPTGTGKTLSLLCSSLSWLLMKKAQLQVKVLESGIENADLKNNFLKQLNKGLNKAAGTSDSSTSINNWLTPKIIYASRTHSQLSQAMQELKRTSYKHVSTAVLGSRDQLCIHPEVSKELNTSNKIHMCHSKIKSRSCFYYNNVETMKDNPAFKENILDIEDLVKAGQQMKCCPYFMSKELKQTADITFMPYNYLLDPITRKSQGIDLQNNVILLDEAHNVEKICEDATSLKISSTDVAMCIDEITVVMKNISKEINETDFSPEESGNAQKDFTPEELCILKAMFLELEKVIDSIKVVNRNEGDTFSGGYIFELLEKVELVHGKEQLVIQKLDQIVSYLTTSSTSPFARKGNALQKFSDLLKTVFSTGTSISEYKEKIIQCYRVYIQIEEERKGHKSDGWETKQVVKKNEGKIINYWCFSPGLGMQELRQQGVRSIIMTSGTLSPLKPFISELGIPIEVQLENPHIVTGQQICIGILSQGPDGCLLNSSFNTRNDSKYIASLGRTIYNFSCLIPHGLLVFFPSYSVMKTCRDEWQNIGLWTKIADRKPIYVEPPSKAGFVNIMNEYYEKIQDPSLKGAIFMAVCRGKVSEGLDFANANGRAVLITGLPFPPMKDPRVILKRRYLDEMRAKNKEGLSGQDWYQLEALRAVNQAIGRIIRHKNDYGAIILCDCRFENPNFKRQLSAWLRPHIKKFKDFGMVAKELREFFRYALKALPQPAMATPKQCSDNNVSLTAVSASFDVTTSCSSKKHISAPATSSNTENMSSIVDMYFNAGEPQRQTEESEKKSFWERLAPESKPHTNFTKCQTKKNSDTCELEKDTAVVPARKKRKIIMKMVEFDAGPSTPSTSSASEKDTETPMESKEADNTSKEIDKRALGKAYLKDVKQSLPEDKYKIFASMVQRYTKTADFDNLLETLENLFSPSDRLGYLLIGFKDFVKKQHISAFNDYIKRKTE